MKQPSLRQERVSESFFPKRLSHFRLSLLLAAAALFYVAAVCPPSAHGQIVTAILEGQVTDNSGAVIAGAKVTEINTSTGVSSTLQTNGSGRFVFTSLIPGGPYTVTAEAQGFSGETRSGIVLTLNQIANVALTLQVGNTTQNVTVVGNANQLNTTTPSLGQVINNRNVVNLPLNQRNVYALVYLAPGAHGTTGGSYNNFNLSVDGGRPGTSLLLLDGIPSAPPGINPNTYVAAFPSVDAVQEFNVMTSNYSAQFGRSGSGVINIVLKSGTNQIQGSVYEFLRNSALDANNYFNNLHGKPLPLFHRSQFGASVSGPVLIPKLYNGKNKTFFLFSFEGLRQGSATQLTTTVPTALERQGDFSQSGYTIYDPATTAPSGSGFVRQPFPNDAIPGTRIDSVAKAVMNYYPLPTSTANVNNFFASGTSIFRTNSLDAKVTEDLNSRNRIFVRYSQNSQITPAALLFPKGPFQIAEGGQNFPDYSHSAAIDYTFTASPTFVIDTEFGFSRVAWDATAVSLGFDPTKLGFPSYIASNADTLIFPGIAAQNFVSLGDSGSGQNRHGGSTIFMLGDNNTKVLGSQVITFGGEAWLLQGDDVESGQSTGAFTFTPAITQGPNPNVATSTGGNSIASLLLGIGSGTMQINSKNAATTARYFDIYGEDDWKATPRLTLNLGLRYDLDVPRTERFNRMETFNPTAPSPLASTTGISGLVGGTVFPGVGGTNRRQFAPQWGNFGPRFGLAYNAGHNTVVHAGYGIYYGASYFTAGETIGQEGFAATTTYSGSPNGLTPSVFLSNPFPTGINRPVGSAQGLLTGIGSNFNTPRINSNKVPYTEAWNFDIQHQFGFNTLVSASYVGSRGVHLNKSGEGDWHANQLSASALALGAQLQQSVTNPFFGIITTGPESAATIPRSFLAAPFPQFTGVNYDFLNGGYQNYDSFQLKVAKDLSHGLSFLLSYTGGKQLDDYSGIENVGNITGGIQNIYNPAAEYAVSSNDISRILVISGVYDLPFGRGRMFGAHWDRAADLALGGWQVNGITTQQTGFPLSPSTQDTSQSGGQTLRPNVTGADPATHGSMKTRINHYVNAAAFSKPAPFTFGNAPRTLSNVRAPGTQNIDLSFFKNFHATERINVQFRAEAFNLLNQVVFGNPNMTLTSGQFGVISSQANTPREIQFALKILF